MRKLIIVSNRLPVSVRKRHGALDYVRSVGGLATGLASLSASGDLEGHQWVGWPGVAHEDVTRKQRQAIADHLSEDHCHPVFLSRSIIRGYYQGFSNKTVWPLFHYFPQYAEFEETHWEGYRKANEVFCDAVLETAQPGDWVWIHDYHLMLLPELLRRREAGLKIGFFLHIPFPAFELFRVLPWREQLLHGLIGADLVGFHTKGYRDHFLDTASRILGLHSDGKQLLYKERAIDAGVFPMGIDYEKFANAAEDPAIENRAARIRKKVGDRKIILSVDRLDYTKGIIKRLEAFDDFLSRYPEYKEKVTLIAIATPSRSRVDQYMRLREQLEGLVGHINGRHGAVGWVPVWYMYRSEPFERLAALYSIADVALVTPLRDGMNLIAKEVLAARADGKVVLILSEMAGAASELREALIVNPQNHRAIVRAMRRALDMPVDEQIERCRTMQARLKVHTIERWGQAFLEALQDSPRRDADAGPVRPSATIAVGVREGKER